MSEELSEVEVEWIAYLIGKIKANELSEENQLKLEQEQAIQEVQAIVGEIPLKPDFLI